MEDLPEGLIEELVPSISPGPPSYTISENILRQVTGISGGTEQDQQLLAVISNGDIDLRKLVAKKENLSEADYMDWLSGKHKEVKAREKHISQNMVY